MDFRAILILLFSVVFFVSFFLFFRIRRLERIRRALLRRNTWKIISNLYSEKEALTSALESLALDFKEGRISLVDFAKKKEEIEKKISEIERRINELIQKEKERGRKARKEVLMIAELRSKVSRLENELQRSRKENELIKRYVDELERKKEELESQIVELKQKNMDLGAKLDDARRMIEKLEERYQMILGGEVDVDSFFRELVEKEKKLEELEKMVSEIKVKEKEFSQIKKERDYFEYVLAKIGELFMPSQDELRKLVLPGRRVFEISSKISKEAESIEERVKKAVNFVNEEIASVPFTGKFWLSAEEVLKLGSGNALDKSVLLCSLLRALGFPEVYVACCDSQFFVALIRGKVYAIKPGESFEKARSFTSLQSLIRELGVKYLFNDMRFWEV